MNLLPLLTTQALSFSSTETRILVYELATPFDDPSTFFVFDRNISKGMGKDFIFSNLSSCNVNNTQ